MVLSERLFIIVKNMEPIKKALIDGTPVIGIEIDEFCAYIKDESGDNIKRLAFNMFKQKDTSKTITLDEALTHIECKLAVENIECCIYTGEVEEGSIGEFMTRYYSQVLHKNVSLATVTIKNNTGIKELLKWEFSVIEWLSPKATSLLETFVDLYVYIKLIKMGISSIASGESTLIEIKADISFADSEINCTGINHEVIKGDKILSSLYDKLKNTIKVEERKMYKKNNCIASIKVPN